MKYLIYFLPLLFASCITRQKCLDRFPPETVIKDSIHVKDTTIIERDTIWLPGEKVELHDTLPCPGIVFHKTFRSNNVSGTVHIENSKISVKCETDSLREIIEKQKQIIETYQLHSSKEQFIEKDWYIPWWIIGLLCVQAAIIIRLLFVKRLM